MASRDPIEHAIHEARREVTQMGLENASEKSILLGGFGYLSDSMRELGATMTKVATTIQSNGRFKRRKRDYVAPMLERGSPWAVIIGLVIYALERAGG